MNTASARPEAAAPMAGKPARRHRVAWTSAAVLGLLVLGVAAAEIAGWPFLAGPMQTALTKALDRPVYLQGAMAPEGAPTVAASAADTSTAPGRAAGGVRLKLFGRIELQAHRIEIAAPSWSKGPPTLVADDAKLRLRYRDLWRAADGGTLRVRDIEADRLEVTLERLADGRASWQFGKPKAANSADKPVAMPVFEQLRVRDGNMAVRDAMTDTEVTAKFSLVDGSAAVLADAGSAVSASAPRVASSRAAGGAAVTSTTGLKAEATGRYRKLPLQLSLHTVGVLPWVAEEAARVGVPLQVNGQIGRARLKFDGAVRDVQQMAGLSGRFSLSGPSLAAVGDVIGVTLPTTAAFSTRGVLSKEGEVWSTRIDEALIGRSSLRAALRFDPTQPTPLLAGRVSGPRLLLADLGPTIGTAPVAPDGAKAKPEVAAAGRVLPDREFDLPSLRAMDANVLLDFDQLDLGTERLQPLEPLRAHLVLHGGVLDVRDIDARTADGSLNGSLSLDGRESVAIWRTDLNWKQVKLEQWLQLKRANGAPPYVTGRLDGSAKLEGRGRSTAQILASLNGELRGRVRDGSISHLVVEGAGIDIAQAIGVFLKGDDSLPLDCAVANLRVDKGIARPKFLVLDSRDSVIWIDGDVSLADETVDLRASVAPRDFSPMALRTPVKLNGTLSDPKVSLTSGPLVRKLAAAGALSLINPLAALLPLMDFGSDDVPANVAGGCKALVKRAVAQRGTATPKS